MKTPDATELNCILAEQYGYLDAKHGQGYSPRLNTPAYDKGFREGQAARHERQQPIVNYAADALRP